jgi:hypothetical protein
LDKLVEALVQEWETVSAAPISVLLLMAASVEIARRAWKWYYRKQIDDRDARIELLRSQLASKEIDIQALQVNQAVDAAYFRAIEEWARRKALDMESSANQSEGPP